jgi:hypothetical protein
VGETLRPEGTGFATLVPPALSGAPFFVRGNGKGTADPDAAKSRGVGVWLNSVEGLQGKTTGKQEPGMNFSRSQWITLIALDIFLRTILFITQPSFALAMLLLSFVYLTLLVFFNFLVEPFKLRPVVAGATILVLTNAFFLPGTFIFLWDFLEIELEKFGELVWYTYTLPVNIVPFLIACALGWLRIGSDQETQTGSNTGPGASEGPTLNFAWYQWTIIGALDVILRGAFFYVINPIFAIIFVPWMSLLNFGPLILTHYFLETFKLHAAVKVAITLATTNTFFFLLTFLPMTWGSSATVWDSLKVMGTQLPINIGPFLMMYALNLLRREAR